MRVKRVLGLLGLAALAAGAAYAGMPAATGVNGSIHDMNMYAGAKDDIYGRVCVFCHTPHNAIVDGNDMGTEPLPLWNHEISTADFTPYRWATPQNLPLTIADPLAGPSRLCMSCHDGVIAVDQHGPSKEYAGTPSAVLSGRGNIGNGGAQSGLFDDHPIGFNYNDAATARNTKRGPTGPGLNDIEVVPSENYFATAITYSTSAGVPNSVDRNGARMIKDTLYQGEIMTCASCHEVHNKENVTQDPPTGVWAGAAAPNYLLYAKEKDSLICLSCHVK